MNHRIAHHATAFGLSAVLTIALLSSINVLALKPAAGIQATSNGVEQVVVIQAKRLPRV